MTYCAHPVVNGFPGKSDSHGSFGWSSVWLLRSLDHVILMETGPPSYIPLLLHGLESHGLLPSDVTDILITHAHWDHLSNITMFPAAKAWIGGHELAWARSLPAGTPFFSPLHIEELHTRGDAAGLVSGGDSILPGIDVLAVPGHTPGHVAYTVESDAGPLIFAGDAVKNLYELATLDVDSTLDRSASRASILRLREHMEMTGARLVPGHDVLLKRTAGQITRSLPQRAHISFFPTADGGDVDRSIGDDNELRDTSP